MYDRDAISLAFILQLIKYIRRSPQREQCSLNHSTTGKLFSNEKMKGIAQNLVSGNQVRDTVPVREK